jgi:hypothetical protein
MDHAAGVGSEKGATQAIQKPPPPPRRDAPGFHGTSPQKMSAAVRGENGSASADRPAAVEEPPEVGVVRDLHGFKIKGDEYIAKYREWIPLHQKKTAERKQKWMEMFRKSPGTSYLEHKDLKKLVRKGIPDSSRGEVWMDVSGAKKLKLANPGYYAKLLAESKRDVNQEAANQIELDLPRTFPDHVSFRGSEETVMTIRLRHVLMAYANRNKVVGYCQGMNFIAGIMLLFLDEESAFWLLCALLELILPVDYYAQDLSGCNVDLRVFKYMLNKRYPKLMKSCEEAGLGVEFFGLEWFIALFGKTLPIETTLRVWDCVFNEGDKILFRIGLGLIDEGEKKLLSIKEPHELFASVQNLGRDSLEADGLLKAGFKLQMKRSQVEDLRKQYRAEVRVERQQRQANKARAS